MEDLTSSLSGDESDSSISSVASSTVQTPEDSPVLGAYTPSKINEAECEPAVLEYSTIGDGEKDGKLDEDAKDVQVADLSAEGQVVASA